MEINFKERLQEKYPNEHLQILQYSNTKKPCRIKCLTCGKVYSFKEGKSAIAKAKKNLCQDCGRREKNKQRFIQSLHDLFPHENFELINFITTQHPVTLKCTKCGTEFHYKKANVIKQKKHLCNQCFPCRSDELKETKKNFLNFIEQKTEWEIITKLDTISSSQELIECKCNYCGKINYKTMYDYMKNIRCSCSRKNDKVNEKIKDICEQEQYICLSLDKKNTYRDRIMLQHSCGYKYSVKAQSFINGYGRCPKCLKKHSRGELLIQQWLVQHSIAFIREYPLCLEGHNLHMDFYLPNEDLYIEYQGEQHFKSIDFFGKEEKYKQRQLYDNLKRKFCKQKLIEIPYNEIDNIDSILTLKVQRPLCTQ